MNLLKLSDIKISKNPHQVLTQSLHDLELQIQKVYKLGAITSIELEVFLISMHVNQN